MPNSGNNSTPVKASEYQYAVVSGEHWRGYYTHQVQTTQTKMVENKTFTVIYNGFIEFSPPGAMPVVVEKQFVAQTCRPLEDTRMKLQHACVT